MPDFDLYLGDCRDKMKEMGESVDLTVTSPPYDEMRNYRGTLEWGEAVWKEVIEGLASVTKPGGVVVWIVDDQTINGKLTLTTHKQALYFEACGLGCYELIIWKKKGAPFTPHRHYQQDHEYMYIFSKGRPNTVNRIEDKRNSTAGCIVKGMQKDGPDGEKNPIKREKFIKEFGPRTRIWEIRYDNYENRHGHPAPFPLKLASDHIVSWSNPGDLVFDPFAGSGTTGEAALREGRRFVGSEKVEKFHREACERIAGVPEFLPGLKP